jgi:hypothetical protein
MIIVNLESSPIAQATASFPEPLGVVGVWTVAGEEVLDGERLTLGVLAGVSTLDVLVGVSLGGLLVGPGEEEGLDLHRLLARFFLAMPWWFGSSLARWSGFIERARVWDGAREQRRIANVDSANMLRSLTEGISSRVVKKREER